MLSVDHLEQTRHFSPGDIILIDGVLYLLLCDSPAWRKSLFFVNMKTGETLHRLDPHVYSKWVFMDNIRNLNNAILGDTIYANSNEKQASPLSSSKGTQETVGTGFGLAPVKPEGASSSSVTISAYAGDEVIHQGWIGRGLDIKSDYLGAK